MRWLITSFTELEHLEPEDRERLGRQGFGMGHLVRIIGTCFFVGGCTGYWVSLLFVHVVGMRGLWASGFIGAAILAGAVLLYQFELIRIRGQLLIYLEKIEKQRRLPMCLVCGYNLEGLTGDACPECGQSLKAPPPGSCG